MVKLGNRYREIILLMPSQGCMLRMPLTRLDPVEDIMDKTRSC